MTAPNFAAPESPADLPALAGRVRELTDAGLAVYPVGGGTGLDYGGPPARPGIALGMTRLDRVIEYPHDDLTITVEAGLSVRRLVERLAEHAQRLPVDVPDADRATVGGAVSVDVSGPRRLSCGTFRDWVIGMSVVNDRGELCASGGRVVKNVAGYDLHKMYTGALGAFGVIATVTFKLQPAPAVSEWVSTALPVGRVAEALNRIHRSETRPAAAEVLNAPAARAVGLAAGEGECRLAVLFENSRAAVTWQIERLAGELGLTWQRDPVDEPALIASPAVSGCAASLLVTARPSAVVGLLAAADSSDYWHAHAMSGIVRVGRPANAPPPLEWAGRWLELAGKADGTAVVRRWSLPGERPNAWGRPLPALAIHRAVKSQFDPRGLLNAGRTAYG